MFEAPGDYLKKKAIELGLDRANSLSRIQTELDRRWAGQTRAVSLKDGVLMIVTPNASLASELRLGQVNLLSDWQRLGVTRLHVRIGSI